MVVLTGVFSNFGTIFAREKKIGLSRLNPNLWNKKRLNPILNNILGIHSSQIWWKKYRIEGRFCPSIDLVCKVGKSALENSSVSFRRSTFLVSFHGFIEMRPRNRSIPPKLCVANSLNNEGKLDCRLFKICVFSGCRFFNKLDLWKTMHRQSMFVLQNNLINGQTRPWAGSARIILNIKKNRMEKAFVEQ